MRLTIPLSLLLVALPLSAPLGAAELESSERYTWIEVQAGYIGQENSNCIENTTALGLAGGQWVLPTWGWEVSALSDKLKDKAGLWKAREDHYDASALYSPFGVQGSWRPYARVGVGYSHLQAPASLSSTATMRTNLALGAGTQLLFGQRGLASLEGRYMNLQTATRRSEYQLVAGVGLRWGKPVAPQVIPASGPTSDPVVEPTPLVEPDPVVVPVPLEPPAQPEVKVVEPALVPAPESQGPTTIVLSDAILRFPNNSFQPAPEATVAIQAVVDELKAYSGPYALQITGHTSSAGNHAHNVRLSNRRAESVAKLLVKAGIPASVMTTRGAGPDEPVADNTTAEGQSRNRRVEIFIKPEDASVEVESARK